MVNNLGRNSNLELCRDANAAIRYLSEWVMAAKVHGLHVMSCVSVCVSLDALHLAVAAFRTTLGGVNKSCDSYDEELNVHAVLLPRKETKKSE